jgi:cytochrome c
MASKLLRSTTAALLSAATVLPALASPDLASKKNCMACHAADKKLVGPSYKDVAAKYQAKDVDSLAQKVLKGGAGVWGPVPMPANPQVSEAEAKELVRWILTVK